jgi:hypothetical protein
MECGGCQEMRRQDLPPDADCFQIPLSLVSQMSTRCHGSFSTIPPWFLLYDSFMTPPRHLSYDASIHGSSMILRHFAPLCDFYLCFFVFGVVRQGPLDKSHRNHKFTICYKWFDPDILLARSHPHPQAFHRENASPNCH